MVIGSTKACVWEEKKNGERIQKSEADQENPQEVNTPQRHKRGSSQQLLHNVPIVHDSAGFCLSLVHRSYEIGTTQASRPDSSAPSALRKPFCVGFVACGGGCGATSTAGDKTHTKQELTTAVVSRPE